MKFGWLIIALIGMNCLAGDTNSVRLLGSKYTATGPVEHYWGGMQSGANTKNPVDENYAAILAAQKRRRLWFAAVFVVIALWFIVFAMLVPQGGRGRYNSNPGSGTGTGRWQGPL
ncbi:MAG: hypothetical protein WCS70_09205 [Verrucomicrobiota bacterium]